MNIVILVGNLGASPETRHTASGTQVTNMRVATTSHYKGEKQTEWHSVVCFGKTAEFADKYLHKGNSVGVEGRIQTRKWEDKDGNDRWTTEVVANRLNFVGGKKSDAGQSEPAPAPAPKAAETPTDLDDDIPF